jgi:hypothetical protein
MEFSGRTARYTLFVNKRNADISDDLTVDTKKIQAKLVATRKKIEQKQMPNIILNYRPDGRRRLGRP